MIEIPRVVLNKARLAGASHWISALPALIRDLENEWSLSVGRTYQDATEAFVAEVSLADGDSAVLKVLVPRDDDAARNEIEVLRRAAGAGCATLLRSDAERGALLIERLGRPLFELGLPIEQRLRILCDAAQQVWRPAPDSHLPSGAEKARWLIDFIEVNWEELDRPCSPRAAEYAMRCAERRAMAHDDERAVLVHGDVHQWNALEAAHGFKLVDPDGLIAERECDLGILMREDPVELLRGDPYDRARWLAHRTQLNADAIWEWGVAERVSTGLLATKVDLQPAGREMLRAADLVSP
jgi:streptomycin 6-kinase